MIGETVSHYRILDKLGGCRQAEARTAIESLRKYNPIFLDLDNVREDQQKWQPDEELVERFMQGLQKAGLKFGATEA